MVSDNQRKRIFHQFLPALAEKYKDRTVEQHFKRLKQISKALSQLIARSWLPGGESIKHAFNHNDSKKIIEMIHKETGINLEEEFGEFELTVDWGTFLARAEQLFLYKEDYLLFTFPYPPRSSEVTDEQLTNWVNNDNPDQEVPNHPYIPLTSGT